MLSAQWLASRSKSPASQDKRNASTLSASVCAIVVDIYVTFRMKRKKMSLSNYPKLIEL